MSPIRKPNPTEDLARTHLIFDVNFCVGMSDTQAIDYRFFLLQNLLLRSLTHQRLQNFTVILNAGTGAWARLHDRLNALIVGLPFRVIVNQVKNISSKGDPYSRVDLAACEYTGILRIDDDDLVVESYTHSVARAAFSFFSSFADRNYLLVYSSEGYIYFPAENTYGPVDCFDFPVAIGVGIVKRRNAPNRFLGAHHEIFSTLTRDRDVASFDIGVLERSWIYTKHKRSDSTTRAGYAAQIRDFSTGAASADIFERFGLSNHTLSSLSTFVAGYPESAFYLSGGKKRLTRLWEIDARLKLLDPATEEYRKAIESLDS